MKRSPWQIQQTVVFALLMREIKTRFGTHWSGVVWLLGQPLAQMGALLAFNMLMQGVLTRGSFDYVLFLAVAYIPYQLCIGLWTLLPNGISANQGLFNYRQVKPFDTIIARTVLEITIDMVVFVLLLLILERFGIEGLIPADPLAYVAAVVLFVLLGMGIGLILAATVGVLPKLSMAVQLLSLPLYFASGILASVHSFPPSVIEYLLYNPILHLSELARASYLPGYLPLQGVSWGFPLAVTLAAWTLGMSLYRVRRRQIASGR